MRTINEFPYNFTETEKVFIPMPDGVQLAARLWLPDTAAGEPVPAILEYIPYRKRDFKRLRDENIHGYFAGHGYASIRVDIRGSGDSEGVLTDEYLEQELADGEAIIAWLAAQPWCNGRVGMIGISWGGFNGLQLAARQPEALKTIITVCSTDDRYKDDVHYMGGCLLGDNLSWASVMFAKNSLPPDPEVVGDKWRKMWFQRLKGSGLWLKNWLQHQTRDRFWQHGSVCENYDDIKIPVMAASGWADGYTNSVFRLVQHLKVPRMGLVGPWSHKYPHMGVPGPAIGFLQECVKWWERWLRGQQNGVENAPKLKVWVQESVPPGTSYEERPGYWTGLEQWPTPIVKPEYFYLQENNRLSRQKSENVRPKGLKSPLRLGMFAGKWCSYAAPPDLPGDQREEDGGALYFETPDLEEKMEILGAPCAHFLLETDKPVAMVAVRLSDVAPDGQATRVTYGIKNLTHRNGHARPEPLVPGKKYRVSVQMNDIAHIFPPGHRLRISVSSSYFPLAWVPPAVAGLKVYMNESSVELPVKTATGNTAISFEEAEGAFSSTEQRMVKSREHAWEVKRDLVTDSSTLRVLIDQGETRLKEADITFGSRTEELYTIFNDSPGTASGQVSDITRLYRKGWDVTTRTRTVLTSDENFFYIKAELDAFEGSHRVFSKNWDEQIPRNLV